MDRVLQSNSIIQVEDFKQTLKEIINENME